MFGWIKHTLSVGFHGILLWLDAIVYEFVSIMYNIFVWLSETNIFSQDFYRDFSQRIYAVLGVFMLFVLAYALLQALVDPEQLTKGDKGISKMVPTFVTSLILIGLLPSIFDFAYNVQNFIIKENTIGILIFGTDTADNSKTRNNFGKQLAYTSLHAFLNAEDAECDEDGGFGDYTCESLQEEIYEKGTFLGIMAMADKIADGKIIYRWGFSTAVGIFLVYIIATFCLDLAARAARLAFLQLIAPVPILMRVLPTKNDMFKKWTQKTIACFTEVFVRIFIMYFAVYLISSIDIEWEPGITSIFANILIIMGILMFVREFPKLLQDITGIDSGNIKLGIKDFMGKLGAGGVLAAGGVLGAGLTAGVRNFRHAAQNNAGLLGTARSTIAGAASGALRGGIRGYNAKNFSDVVKAAGAGAKGATDARNSREAYRASHPDGVMRGHFSDMLTNVSEWSQGGFEAEEAEIKFYNDLLAQKDKAKSEAESVMNKYLNNASVVERHVEFKGTEEQKAAMQALLNRYQNDGIATMESAYNRMKTSEVDRDQFYTELPGANGQMMRTFNQAAYDEAVRNRDREVANMESMIAQVKKATIKRIQSAAYDEDLMVEMGFTTKDSAGNVIADPTKLSGIRKEIDQARDLVKEHGDIRSDDITHSIFDDGPAGNTLDDYMTDIENVRNASSAALERKKRARERRQRNNNNNS